MTTPRGTDQPRWLARQVFDVSDETVLVTGGGTGLGRAIAEILVVNGARVVVAGKDETGMADLSDSLSNAPGGLVSCVADVTDDAAIARLFDAAESAFGTVGVLFNGAGIGHRGAALETDRESWRAVLEVNTESAFVVAREAARRMVDARIEGSIINIASFLHDRPMRNVAAYAASKAAMHQMTRSLAVEWARHGIRVNEIVPGWFPTVMTEPFLGGRAGAVVAATNPMRRLGTPADLAGVALLLASSASAYMTGASIAVDGGQSLA